MKDGINVLPEVRVGVIGMLGRADEKTCKVLSLLFVPYLLILMGSADSPTYMQKDVSFAYGGCLCYRLKTCPTCGRILYEFCRGVIRHTAMVFLKTGRGTCACGVTVAGTHGMFRMVVGYVHEGYGKALVITCTFRDFQSEVNL